MSKSRLGRRDAFDRWTQPLLLGALLMSAACDGSPTLPPPILPLSIELGTVEPRVTGDNRWVALTPDKVVELAPGAQGGFHLWTMIRIKNGQPKQTVRMFRIIERLGDETGTVRQRVLTAPEARPELPGPLYETVDPIPSFMCPTPIGVNVLDAPLELQLKVLAQPGDENPIGEARVRIRATCPPEGDPQREFCLRICKG